MFNIENGRKVGELSFYTAKGRPVTLHPGRSRTFGVDELNPSILRNLIGKGSHYNVRADSEEAEALVQEAKNYKGRKGGSPIVHGSTEPSPFAAKNAEITVTDLKGDGTEAQKVFIKEEKTDETPQEQKHPPDLKPAQQPQPPPPPPEKSALELLIEAGTNMPFTEFRTKVKEELGDLFPAGQPGRPALITALKEKHAQSSAPQSQE